MTTSWKKEITLKDFMEMPESKISPGKEVVEICVKALIEHPELKQPIQIFLTDKGLWFKVEESFRKALGF